MLSDFIFMHEQKLLLVEYTLIPSVKSIGNYLIPWKDTLRKFNKQKRVGIMKSCFVKSILETLNSVSNLH
jgi:hypothetical protein